MENKLRPTQDELKKRANRRMMVFVGIAIILAFLFQLVAVTLLPGLDQNQLAVHMLGVVEGALFMVAGHYFGDSVRNDTK